MQARTFEEKIKAIDSITFDAVIDIVAQTMSYEECVDAWKYLKNGIRILQSEELLDKYLVAYGKMHLSKVKYFLDYLPWDKLEKSGVVIFDWGCGQGLATAALFDYIRAKNINVKIYAVRLIEISLLARKRAECLIQKYNLASNVVSYDWDLQYLQSVNFFSNKSVPRIHLFSNILDVSAIDLSLLHNTVEKVSQEGINYLLSVSPKNKYVESQRIKDFYDMFENKVILKFNQDSIPFYSKWCSFNRCSCYGICYEITSAINTRKQCVESASSPIFDKNDLLDFVSANFFDGVLEVLRFGIDVNSCDELGYTPLMFAAKYGYDEILQCLIDKGADVNRHSIKGATALYFAAKYNHYKCVEHLLNAHANTELAIFHSRITPYFIAELNGHEDIVKLLETRGCDILVCDNRGRTPNDLKRLILNGD